MPFAFWIPPTLRICNTVAFRLQHWLRERASVLPVLSSDLDLHVLLFDYFFYVTATCKHQ